MHSELTLGSGENAETSMHNQSGGQILPFPKQSSCVHTGRFGAAQNGAAPPQSAEVAHDKPKSV